VSKSKKKKSRKKKKINPRVNLENSALIERVKKSERFSGAEIIINPPNKEKMSEVLKDFVAPFLDECVDNIQMRTVISIGLIVWNASQLPEEKQQAILNKMKYLLPIREKKDEHLFHENVIKTLLKRKKDYFSSNKRVLLDHQFSEHNGELSLDVVSTLLGEENG
jgi:hypothetical protein